MNRFAPAGRKPTISDVATHAGVSKTTVSHVVSGNRPVARRTRERVQRSIAELGYRPHGPARSLRTKRSHMVALIIPDITNPFYPVLARGLEDSLGTHGYRTFACNTDGLEDQELEYIAEMFNRGVDGIVLVSFHLRPARLGEIMAAGMPLVTVGHDLSDGPADVIRADDERGAFDATTHLVSRGHRRIAMIAGPPGSGLLREDGYRRALGEAGILFDSSLLVNANWTRLGGNRAMRELLALEGRPTAVFCGNDMTAVGAMDAAREAGLRLPRDLALVGFDDIEAAALVDPPLTTVVNPAYETGSVAGRMLFERMTGAYQGPRRTAVLPCTLVIRESS